MSRLTAVVVSLVIALSAAVWLARAGQVNPPSGAVGPSGPSLRDVLDAVNNQGQGGGGSFKVFPPFAQMSPPALESDSRVAFLKMTGQVQGAIPGESTYERYRNFIEVIALDYDLSLNPNNTLNHGDVRLVVVVDRALPILMQSLVMRENLTADIRIVQNGPQGEFVESLLLKFNSARVLGIRYLGLNVGVLGFYELRLMYETASIEDPEAGILTEYSVFEVAK